MSTNSQTAHPSLSNFTQIFDTAIDDYKRLTKQDLHIHPFAAAFNICTTPDTILDIFQTQAKAFDSFRKGDDKLMRWLNPTVQVLFTLSATLGEGIGLPFSPAKTIFTGIGVLLGTMKDVVASYDMLVKLFERIQFFLQRLNCYTDIRLTTAMTELLAKIMTQVLMILALSTKVMKERRIKAFLRRLMGKTDVDDALQRLDSLTKEEGLMAAARNLQVTAHVDENVVTIKEIIHDVNSNTKATKKLTHNVDTNVTTVKEVISGVDSNIKVASELTRKVDSNVMIIKEAVHDIDSSLRVTNELTCKVANDVNVTERIVRNIDDNVEVTKLATYELQRNQSRETLRAWLSPPNPSANHNLAWDTHHEGTAMWFTHSSKFNDWKRNGSLLWIHGNPGSGKSILCSTIIEDIKHLREAKTALVAFYYFDFKDAAKRHLRGLLSSLLIQLCDDSLGCWDLLHQLYTTCRYGSEQASEAALAECLKHILDIPGQVPIYIIIDALDECPDTTGSPSDRNKVLDFVDDLVGHKHSSLYICITSRPEQDIQSILNPLTSISCRVSLHEEGGQKEDINSYIRYFVHSNKTMRRWRDDDKELVISTLTERAGGSFRWVYCQLDALCRCFPSSIRRALDELPDTLDGTYERTLQEIPKQKRQHAHRLFQCLVAAIRPLRVDELAEIFTVEFDAEATYNLVEDWRPEDAQEAVLSACTTLISIIDDKDRKIVQFSHFSVEEFLTSDRFRTSNIGDNFHYYIPLDDAHTILARACLTVLLQLDERTDKKRLAKFPLVLYATWYWVDHVKFEGVASRVHDAMEHLFDTKKPYFGAWVWIHSPGWRNKEAMNGLTERPSPPDETPLYWAAVYGLIGLARQFVVTHNEDVNTPCGILGSPLHAASDQGHLDIVRLLLDHGAKVNLRNARGCIPLQYSGHLEVKRLLLQHGANVTNTRGTAYGTQLHDAAYCGQPEIVHLLLQYNADVNARGGDDWLTPLHLASFYGHAKVAQILLEHGADVNAVDGRTMTPLDCATQCHHDDIVRLLLEHGGRRSSWHQLCEAEAKKQATHEPEHSSDDS